MALKDEWRQHRIQRQQEVKERQQTVQDNLTLWQQERQLQAIEFQDLRQAFVSQIQQQTQDLLTNNREQRRLSEEELRQHLEDFVQQLSQEVAEFLQQTSQERAMTAMELNQQLQQFRADLGIQVNELLAEYQAQRLQAREPLRENLATFRQQLSEDVEAYLNQVNLLHQQMSQQLQQQLQDSRIQRQDSVQALFDDLGKFRTELRNHHQKLQQSVWGQETRVVQKRPVAKAPVRTTRPAGFSQKTAIPRKAPLQTKPAAKPQAKPVLTNGSKATVSRPVQPPVAVPAVQVEPPSCEQKVYNYIQTHTGARLAEIEQSLGINRVQTVDAIRVLLQQGRITQRDRIYVVAK